MTISNNSWLSRLKSGLSKTSDKISHGLADIFLRKRIDTLEQLEELLIESDVGVATASLLAQKLTSRKFEKDVTVQEVKQFLSEQIASILNISTPAIDITSHKPYIFLIIGVNGNGKTTTIGKLACYFQEFTKRIGIAACDTFRAAAVNQLAIWAERAKAELISAAENADPASVAYNAVVIARDRLDLLLIDTAGRMHNKANLMDELSKIIRTMQKIDPLVPHQTLIVIDATTGQNALSQIEQFSKIVKIDGIVVTKLDGTAKAGIVIAIAQKFNIPIRYIGIGEQINDIRAFDPVAFANNLLGLE
jgi:fused signal recognition particle receptor